MNLALQLAKKADPHPNPRVGAVLIKGGKVIGKGFHKAPGLAHAEIAAIEDAKGSTGDKQAARGATLYVTLEPCSHKAKRTPPCTKAIIREGIREVVYAMDDPNPLVCGARELRHAGIKVRGPTDPKAASRLNRKYIRQVAKKPFVAIKMAMSADGRVATRTGDSKWISGKRSRALVHKMRAGFDAVMVGAGTVAADDPSLTSHGNGRDPYRVLVDGRLSTSLDAGILRRQDGLTIIATSQKADRAKAIAIERMGHRVLICGKRWVDMRMLMMTLGAMGMKKILIEGGAELNAKALEAKIVDRVLFFIAPKLIGGRGAPSAIGGAGAATVSQAVRLSGMKAKKIGGDLLLQFDISA